jgi:aryl-alcohol dehydrogenase-like predicted oxidoreductase
MKYVHLGNSNLLVSEFCLGTMMFGGKTSAEESVAIIHKAVDAGVNFVDTADVYNAGRSEEIVGQALQGSLRDRVVLASKVGMRVGDGPNDAGISRYHIVRGAEASLRRLNTDRLDIFYIHWPTEAMHLEEMLRALQDLISAGKVLYPACSNFPAWLFCRCLGLAELRNLAPLVLGQHAYNLIERGIEVELLPFAAAMGLGIVTYRPLGGGVLTGKYAAGVPNDARGANEAHQPTWASTYAEGIGRLVAFSEARGFTAADAAIAWARSHPVVTAPIVGISRLDQLEANLRGFDWELSAEERAEITSYFATAVWEERGTKMPDWRRSYAIANR